MFALAFERAVWSISWMSFVSFAIVAASGGWPELRFVSPSASAIFAYASEITLKSGRMSGGAFSESAFRYAEYVFTLPLALPVIAWLSWDERLTRSRQFLDVAMPAAIAAAAAVVVVVVVCACVAAAFPPLFLLPHPAATRAVAASSAIRIETGLRCTRAPSFG